MSDAVVDPGGGAPHWSSNTQHRQLCNRPQLLGEGGPIPAVPASLWSRLPGQLCPSRPASCRRSSEWGRNPSAQSLAPPRLPAQLVRRCGSHPDPVLLQLLFYYALLTWISPTMGARKSNPNHPSYKSFHPHGRLFITKHSPALLFMCTCGTCLKIQIRPCHLQGAWLGFVVVIGRNYLPGSTQPSYVVLHLFNGIRVFKKCVL